MPMPVTIGEAQPRDAEQLLAYVHRLITEPNLDIPLTADDFKLSVEEERQILADYVAADNAIFLVAEAGGQIIGQLTCQGGQCQASRHTVILGVSVGKEWRGKGVGSALMAWAIQWAKQTGTVSRIELNVYARNAVAIHLYEKHGFEVEGLCRRAIYQNQEYLDDLMMALLL